MGDALYADRLAVGDAARTAPTVFSSISKAPRICSAARKGCIADLAGRLENNFGLPARLAVADTPGTAWALARFHAAPSPVLPSGQEAAALAPLPVEALRLSPETCTTLRRLGFKTVGALLDKPRAPFAARFPAELLRRLDQALGRVDEPLVPIVAPPVYHSLRYLLEPILTQEAVVAPRQPPHADPGARARAATMSARARLRLSSTASMARWRRSISG